MRTSYVLTCNKLPFAGSISLYRRFSIIEMIIIMYAPRVNYLRSGWFRRSDGGVVLPLQILLLHIRDIVDVGYFCWLRTLAAIERKTTKSIDHTIVIVGVRNVVDLSYLLSAFTNVRTSSMCLDPFIFTLPSPYRSSCRLTLHPKYGDTLRLPSHDIAR